MAKTRIIQDIENWEKRTRDFSGYYSNLESFGYTHIGHRISQKSTAYHNALLKIGVYNSFILMFGTNKPVYFTTDWKPFYVDDSGEWVYINPYAKVRYFKNAYPGTLKGNLPTTEWDGVQHDPDYEKHLQEYRDWGQDVDVDMYYNIK